MPSTAVVTVVRMLEELPEAAQNQIVEHPREYLQDFQDEDRWRDTFKKTRAQLVAAARKAKREIAGGQAKPLDHGRL